MKHTMSSENKPQVSASHPKAVENLARGEANFAPSPDEVARRAYFSYVNQGSLPGRDVQHWLEAEAQLIAERDLKRVHMSHNGRN